MAQSRDDLVNWAASARAALTALLDTSDDRLCRSHATLARDRLLGGVGDGRSEHETPSVRAEGQSGA